MRYTVSLLYYTCSWKAATRIIVGRAGQVRIAARPEFLLHERQWEGRGCYVFVALHYCNFVGDSPQFWHAQNYRHRGQY